MASSGGEFTSGGLGAGADCDGGHVNDSNLFERFEESYKETLATLTQEDSVYDRCPEALQQELESKLLRFTDLARQLETFFSQRRLLLHVHRPEVILKEDSIEMRQELARKEDLLRKHYEKVSRWTELLNDGPSGPGAPETLPQQQQQFPAVHPQHQQTSPVRPGLQPGAPLPPGAGAPQGGFVPGHNYRAAPQQYAQGGGVAGGPLAYLEKTTTNIGGGGPGGPPYHVGR